MNSRQSAEAYFAAWNDHDGDAITATFAPEGTYEDPTTGRIPGAGVAATAQQLWQAFPDLAFEVISEEEAGDGRIVAEWLMTGTNSGPFQGLPPTGRSIALPGADFIDCGPDGINSVRGYFDSRGVPAQLGLQIVVQPDAIGPFTFGTSTAVQAGKATRPGAFSITTLFSHGEQTEEIKDLSRETATEMLGMEGFIGIEMIRQGGRGVTVTAWEKPEQARQLMTSPSHKQAMQRFWSDLGDAAYTSLWVPEHINTLWVRCTACGKMSDYEKLEGNCGCGEALPERPTYF
ncbi:MAG: SnoaL-like domain-containing protein [Gammaproteobacteria bacterium]|nr:ester cyclase [Gammaproteobacteria bacterium]NNM00127.1 SnoaL-like domain-containing protein [Gammaproteobacteria bacterium]